MIKKWNFNTTKFGCTRNFIQVIFLITVIVIGYKFYNFTAQLEIGVIPEIDRPPGVEGFLPISALISLKYFFQTRIINDVHPSGLLIFSVYLGSFPPDQEKFLQLCLSDRFFIRNIGQNTSEDF